MVYKIAILHCDQCSREYGDTDEEIKALRFYAKRDGWIYKKMENGSYWDLCPKCAKEEK